MRADNLALNPPIQYSIIWLIIGTILFVCLLSWFGTLFWMTRRKKVKTLETLGAGESDFDLEKLKAKYLKMIDECYRSYEQKQTDLRGLHRALSMAVRYFVYEARHFPAPRLTLTDLKRAPYPNLANLVEEYYGKEFAMIEHGDALKAVEAAKKMVQQWV